MTEQPLLPDPLTSAVPSLPAELGARVRARVGRRRRRRTAAGVVLAVLVTSASVSLWPRGDDGAQTLLEGPQGEYVKGSWMVLPDSPLSPRRPYGVVAVGEEALVLGGSGTCPDRSVCSDAGKAAQLLDAAAYDVGERRWRTLADLPEPIFTEAVVDGLVLAQHIEPGGVLRLGDAAGPAPRRWLYDVATDTWERMPDPPSQGVTMVPVGDVLLAVPQDNGQARSDALAVFDPQRRAWSRLPDSPLAERLSGSPLEAAIRLEVLRSASGVVALVGQDSIGLSPTRPATPVLRYALLDLASATWGTSGVLPECSTRAPGRDALTDDEVLLQSDAALNARRDRQVPVDATPVVLNLRELTCSGLSASPPYGSARGRDGLNVVSGGDYVAVGTAGPLLDTQTGRYLIYPPGIPREVPSYAATTWVDGRFFAWGGGRDEVAPYGFFQEDFLMSSGAVWTP